MAPSAKGRCPHCEESASFSLVEKCTFGRDEYRCDKCGGDVAECKYLQAKGCYGWAPRVGRKWREFCATCASDTTRVQQANRDAEYWRNLGAQGGQWPRKKP